MVTIRQINEFQEFEFYCDVCLKKENIKARSFEDFRIWLDSKLEHEKECHGGMPALTVVHIIKEG